MTGERRSNFELVTTDVFALEDAQLRYFISELQAERNHLKASVIPSVSECNALIALAHAELASRATEKLARTALWVSMTSVALTLATTLFGVLIG